MYIYLSSVLQKNKIESLMSKVKVRGSLVEWDQMAGIIIEYYIQKRKLLKENQMEPSQSNDQKIGNFLLKNEERDIEPINYRPQPLALHPHPTLSLDHNPHSLALGVRNSIQNGIPIPRNMLSHSDDHEPLPEEDSSKEMPFDSNKIKIECNQFDNRDWFVEELGLNQLLFFNKGPNNTKNVLRNFGNAQNQYILYHKDAKKYVEEKLATPEKFYKWIRGMKLEKFQNFKQVWSSDELNLVFRRVYRELCFKFYIECAIPYVLSSRMKNENTKLSHLRYIYRFLEGIKDPFSFSYFKKSDK